MTFHINCDAAGSVRRWALVFASLALSNGAIPRMATAAESPSAAGSLKQGEAFLEESERGKAIAAFSEAIRIDPKNARAYYLRASAYQRSGDAEKASADLTAAVRLDPKGFRAYLNRGWAYGRSRQLDKAIAKLTEVIQAYPAYEQQYRRARALASFLKGDFDGVISDCGAILRATPGDAAALTNRGLAYLERGKVGEAISDGTAAVLAMPADAPIYVNRGWAFAERGDNDAALADANKALKLDPNSSEAFAIRGYVFDKQGKRETAKADYATAIRLESKNNHGTERRWLLSCLVGKEARPLILPVYQSLAQQEIRNELGMSPKQEQELRSIESDFMAETGKLKQISSMQPLEYRKEYEKIVDPLRKRIKELLTSQQFEALKKRMFAQTVCDMLLFPDYLGLHREQVQKLRQLEVELVQRLDKEAAEEDADLLALLDASQQQQLRACAKQHLRTLVGGAYEAATLTVNFTSEEAPPPAKNDGKTTAAPKATGASPAPADVKSPIEAMSLPVYRPLLNRSVRKRLGLNVAQQTQLREIAAKCGAEEKKRLEAAQKAGVPTAWDAKTAETVCRQIESVLTSQQLTALNELNFEDGLPHLLKDVYVQDDIGLSARQRAGVASAFLAASRRESQSLGKTADKAQQIMSDEQKKRMFGAWGESYLDNAVVPTSNWRQASSLPSITLENPKK